MSTLSVQLEEQTARVKDRTGHLPSCANSKRNTIARLRDRSSLPQSVSWIKFFKIFLQLTMAFYENQRTKYDIPLSHLDHKYIPQCKDVKELEKILKVLRSVNSFSLHIYVFVQIHNI